MYLDYPGIRDASRLERIRESYLRQGEANRVWNSYIIRPCNGDGMTQRERANKKPWNGSGRRND